jgi:nitroreductase
MDFFEVINKRYSVRAYKADPVPDEVLKQVLNAAVIAPTAANKQPFQIIVIETNGRVEELKQIYNREWFVQAPLVLCFCGVPEQGWARRMDSKSYMMVDVAIAADHLILAAAALGLGTCWIAAFDVNAARTVLGLPETVEPIIFTPLGYPADQPKGKTRKSPDDLVRYNRW